MLSATTFYRPVTPPGQVDLGISFAAIQWLADPGPSDGGTALYFDQLDEPVRARMADLAHRDWKGFLELRADALAPGGRLILDMVGIPEGGVAEVKRTFGEAIGERLELEELSIGPVPNPILERYRGDGDAATMAKGLVGFLRAFSEPSLRAGLALDDSTAAELHARIETRVLLDAESIAFEIHPITVVIRAAAGSQPSAG